MILITGGKGFIGLHLARALIDAGESCVITTSHPERSLPRFLEGEVGSRLFVECVDLRDGQAVRALGTRRPISSVVELASAPARPFGTPESFRQGIAVLLNLLDAAKEWGVRRVSLASTVGVYGGVEGDPLREDAPLPSIPLHPIPAFKRAAETIAASIGASAGMEVIALRLAAWGPLAHHPPSAMNVPMQMVRAAVRGARLDLLKPPSRAFAEDGADVAYVRDCARAIALLQLAPRLNHGIYNIGAGRAMRNREVVAAIKRIIPGVGLELPAGSDPQGPGRVFELDTSRLRADTGFAPAYDVERAVAEYIAWLRAGNEE